MFHVSKASKKPKDVPPGKAIQEMKTSPSVPKSMACSQIFKNRGGDSAEQGEIYIKDDEAV